MKIGFENPNPKKMSIGWIYSGGFCPFHIRHDRWSKRGGQNKNHKAKTLRTHRKGTVGKNARRSSILSNNQIGIKLCK